MEYPEEDLYAYISKEYPRNDFNAYVNYVYDKHKMRRTNNFLLKFVKILPVLIWQTLKDATVELLFLMLFWVVLAKMPQGRDMIVSLFEPDGIYGYGRIILTTLAALSLSASMWIIPVFMFHQREKRSGNSQRPLHEHLFFMHRVLPLIPFWLMASVLFNDAGKVFVLISITVLVALYFFNKWVTNDEKRWRAIVMAGALFVAFSVWFFMIFHREYTAAKVLLAANLYILSILMYLIYHWADNQLLRAHHRSESTGRFIKKYKINSTVYLCLLAIHAILITTFFFMPFPFSIAPESMLLYVFSVYVFIIDLFIYFVKVSTNRKFIAAGIFIVLVILKFTSVWDFNTTHYAMDKNPCNNEFEKFSRDSFETRYNILRDSINANGSGIPYPIILVSGEGGGSRAGFWFSQNLINFDYDTKGRFRNYIFSISSVSGSSVGLSTYLTFLEKTRDAKEIDAKWVNFPSALYENNFVGSSIRGLLLTDLYKSFWPFKSTKDRNSTLQSEEADYTERAILKINGDKEWKSREVCGPMMTLKKDFMSFFYEKKKDSGFQYRRNMPIVLVNTCRSNDGRRGIFSTIKLDALYFNEAIDVAGYLYEDSICDIKGKKQCYGKKMPVSLGQVCNTSELFPILSAPAYIDNLGSFVDAGYHENSGLKSTLDIYQQLKRKLENDTSLYGTYKIYILYLKNGSGDKQLYKEMESEPVLLQPIIALYKQPFVGSASYFEDRAEVLSAIDNKAEFISIKLIPQILIDTSLKSGSEKDKKSKKEKDTLDLAALRKKLEPQILPDLINEIITDTTRRDSSGKFVKDTVLRFPLARWLSKTVIDRMLMCAQRDYRSSYMKALINHVNDRNSVSAPVYKPLENARIHEEIKKRMDDDTAYKNAILKRLSINKPPENK